MINLVGLADAKIGDGSKNSSLQVIWSSVQAYNSLGPGVTIQYRVELLERLLRSVTMWLTDHPPKLTERNKNRWNALRHLAEEVGMDAQRLGIRFLTAPGDAKKIGNPVAEVGGNPVRTGKERSYWLELVDPKHRPGFILSAQYEEWLRQSPELGHGERGKSFWEYLGEQYPIAEEIKYYGGTAKAAKRVVKFENGRLVYTNPLLWGDPFSTRDLKTMASGPGWGIFVVDMEGNLYIHKHVEGIYHHSTFLSGGAVQAAGEIVVDNGLVKVISGKSGHYMPEEVEMKRFVRMFPDLPDDAIIRPVFKGAPKFYGVRDHRDNPAPVELSQTWVRNAIPDWARNHANVTGMIDKIKYAL